MCCFVIYTRSLIHKEISFGAKYQEEKLMKQIHKLFIDFDESFFFFTKYQ